MIGTKSGKKVNKAIIIAIIIGIVIICSALLVIIKINSEKRRSEYIASRTFILEKDDFLFSFSTYDGYGIPHVNIDRFKVFDVLLPALGYKEENIKTEPIMLEIYENITVTFSENSKLSNGQIITAYISVNEDCLEKYDIYFEEMECQVTVEGLKEIKDVDIFENLYIDSVEDDGSNSVIWKYMGNNNLFIEGCIMCSPSGGLNFGDKFVLSVDDVRAEELKEEYGINPVNMEKEYVLLEPEYEYLSEFENISDKLIDELNRSDIGEISKNAEYYEVVSNAQCMGGFIYRFENGQTDNRENCLVLIYEMDNPDKDIDVEKIYVWTVHYDVVQNAYGMQSYDTDFSYEGYPEIKYNNEKGVYEGADIEDAIAAALEGTELTEKNISYDSALKLYFE